MVDKAIVEFARVVEEQHVLPGSPFDGGDSMLRDRVSVLGFAGNAIGGGACLRLSLIPTIPLSEIVGLCLRRQHKLWSPRARTNGRRGRGNTVQLNRNGAKRSRNPSALNVGPNITAQ